MYVCGYVQTTIHQADTWIICTHVLIRILNTSYCKSGNFIVDNYYACSFAYEILKCKLQLDK